MWLNGAELFMLPESVIKLYISGKNGAGWCFDWMIVSWASIALEIKHKYCSMVPNDLCMLSTSI